jgi:hypothetical protein
MSDVTDAPAPRRRPSSRALALPAIALVAVALRVHGIDWGLPDPSHPDYSYDPDEAPTLLWARWLVEGQLIAKHFIYGGTLYYTILNTFHHLGALLAPLTDSGNPLADAILAGRCFLVGIALLTIALLYEAGRILHGRPVGLLAALMLALSPAHVVWAQRVRPDEIGTLLVVLMLYLAARLLRAPAEQERRWLILSGAAIGVALALRFPLVVFGAMPALAWLLRTEHAGFGAALRAFALGRAWLLAAAALLAYAVASPHSWLHPEWLLAGLQVTWQYESGVFTDSIDAGVGVYRAGYRMLRQALGTPLYWLALAGVAAALAQRRREQLLVLAGALPYFVLTALATWMVVRYTLPLLPLLVLLAALLVHDALARLARYRHALVALLAAALLWTALGTLAFVRVEARRNVRDVVSDWIAREVDPGTTILTVRQYLEDVYMNPVIAPDRRNLILLLGPGADATALFAHEPIEYVILHEMVYLNMERLGDRHPQAQVPAFRRALEEAGYTLVREFKQPVVALGIDFAHNYTAHDYAVVNPGIRVYRRGGAR